jgi:6-phosphogluconolactonase
VDEQTTGQIVTLAPGWRRRGATSTGGADPCHAALDAAQSCLAIANYGGGSVALLRLDPTTGAPVGPPLVRMHPGHGPVVARQTSAHAHWVGFSPDNLWLHAVDLGADAIFAHRYDAARGALDDGVIAYAAPAGSGPRHIVRHPRAQRAYLVSELANTVTTLSARADGRFAALAIASSLPAGFAGQSAAAHIAIDAAGDRLYVSNRGHDSIAVFAIDRTGDLALLQHVPSGGHWPRFFLLLERERRLVVANERSGTLCILRLAADGRLVPTNTSLDVPGGVFIGHFETPS